MGVSMVLKEQSVIHGPEDIDSLVNGLSRFNIHKKKFESFYIITLDGGNIPTHLIEVTSGLVNKTLVHCREVFYYAIKYLAVNIVCVHNHPSGSLISSPEDSNVFRSIRECGKIINIPLLDFIIVSKKGFYSYLKDGHFN